MKRFDTICKRAKCMHRAVAKLKHDKGFVCDLMCREQIALNNEDCVILTKCGRCISITDVPLRCPYRVEMAVKQ